jgi:predicted nucleic acid binding AN1-type Zn finger protein
MPFENGKYYCDVCNKKLSLFAIKCRCDKFLCGLHRYNSDHDCKYDYKRKYKEELEIKLDNSDIKKLKVDKI